MCENQYSRENTQYPRAGSAISSHVDDERGQVVLNGQSLSSFAMRIVDE